MIFPYNNKLTYVTHRSCDRGDFFNVSIQNKSDLDKYAMCSSDIIVRSGMRLRVTGTVKLSITFEALLTESLIRFSHSIIPHRCDISIVSNGVPL